jgi:hypothetical protein
LAVQHGYAQIAPRQIERDRPADNAPADNQHIVCFHANILSAIPLQGGLSRFKKFRGYGAWPRSEWRRQQPMGLCPCKGKPRQTEQVAEEF